MSAPCSIGIILNKERHPAWRWNFADVPDKAHGGWLEIRCNRPGPHPKEGAHWYEDDPGEWGVRVTWRVPAGATWIA